MQDLDPAGYTSRHYRYLRYGIQDADYIVNLEWLSYEEYRAQG